MRIESFWARGYRSLRDVLIEGLEPFNVFYGPNGGGKSNILEAIATLIGLARVAASTEVLPTSPTREAADAAIERGIIARRDLCLRDPSRIIVLGACFSGVEALSPISGASDLTLELTLDWIIESEPKLSVSKLCSGEVNLLELWMTLGVAVNEPGAREKNAERRERRERVRALLLDEMPKRAFGLISADRAPRPETSLPLPPEQDIVQWHLREGRLKSALLSAQIGPDHEVRRRLAALRALLAGPPLHRPPFDPVQDQRTGAIDLRELLPEPNPEGRDISIDLAGLGIAQIYAVLAKAMLLGARAVGIEEPEAHLHAPTSGRALRQLLVRLVEEKHVDQLFIATHSNLFDLDPGGYYDVSLVDGCTAIKREDLTRIDRDHLYEPGPAKHALQKLLQYAPEGEVVFRRGDGSGVTAKEMLELLQQDDEVAVNFLQDIHGAAVRMVKVRTASRPAGG